jgi:hypothetical protein
MVLNRFGTVVIGFMLLAASTPETLAQRETGSIHISGRVSPALKLSLGSNLQLPDGAQAVVEASGLDFIQIGLRGDGHSIASQISIPLEIRTNVSYELRLSFLSREGCMQGLTASIGAVLPSGASVVAGAAETSRTTGIIDLVDHSDSMPILTGPRISARGNFATAGNALLVHLNIAMREGQKAGCPWRASVRILLHPSA